MKIFDLDTFLINVQKEEEVCSVKFGDGVVVGNKDTIDPEFEQAFQLFRTFMKTELSECEITLDELALVNDHVAEIEELLSEDASPGFQIIWFRLHKARSMKRRVL